MGLKCKDLRLTCDLQNNDMALPLKDKHILYNNNVPPQHGESIYRFILTVKKKSLVLTLYSFRYLMF